MQVKSYLVYFIYQHTTGTQGVGAATMIQKEYKPITQKSILEDVKLIREYYNFPESTNITILNWKRFEADDPEE